MATQAATSGQAVGSKVEVKATELDRDLSAAFLASGIGSVALGLAVIVTEMKAGAGIKTALQWVGPVGPLSGKTGVSVIAFIVSWVVLHFALKGREVKLVTMFALSIVMVVLGLLMTYPPIFDLFAK